MSVRRPAVVIGAGHNGLVAANVLADAGWSVLVLEAQPRLGGAVYSDGSLEPGFVTDWYSAFYPLAAASPVIRAFELESYGLRWAHAPSVLAHVLPDGRAAVLSHDRSQTAASLEQFAPGDGAAWLAAVRDFERIRDELLAALFTPFPPVRAGLGLARTLGVADLLRFLRFAVQPVRSFSTARFRGEGAALLLAGNALHADLTPDTAGSAIFGWLLAMLGQTEGFPAPQGGSGRLVTALADRLVANGGEIRTNAPVDRIEVGSAGVRAVHLADGRRIATDVVLADVDAPHLYRDLLSPNHVPARLLRDLDEFEWDDPTLKLNWTLSGPIPWSNPDARGAGTVHLGVDMAELALYATSLASGRLPDPPFLLLGQMTTTDPTRSPQGTESAWAYTHLPRQLARDAGAIDVQVKRVEAVIERAAPGFGDLVRNRRVQRPLDIETADGNLVCGAVNGGTAKISQQLVFRPVPGLGRPETPIDGLYLAGSSAHPGGGVHGAPGANAAAAALRRARAGGGVHRRVIDLAYRHIYR